MATVTYFKPLKIQEWATADRPREKLVEKGRSALSDAELLAILIGSGLQHISAVDLAQHILKNCDNDLRRLNQLSVEELKRFKGIGEARAVTIISALELATRLQFSAVALAPTIDSSAKAYASLQKELYGKQTEEFWVLLLNNNNKLIKKAQISRGGLTKTIVDPRLVFKEALAHQVPALILVHNHPSGNLVPSTADKELTQRLVKGGDLLSLRVLDHIIFTDSSYFSFADEGLLADSEI